MNLYFIHCGYYDEEISDGIFEFHVNLPVAAETLEEAKRKVRLEPAFEKKKMHIADGANKSYFLSQRIVSKGMYRRVEIEMISPWSGWIFNGYS